MSTTIKRRFKVGQIVILLDHDKHMGHIQQVLGYTCDGDVATVFPAMLPSDRHVFYFPESELEDARQYGLGIVPLADPLAGAPARELLLADIDQDYA
jgi:hypothetical protein